MSLSPETGKTTGDSLLAAGVELYSLYACHREIMYYYPCTKKNKSKNNEHRDTTLETGAIYMYMYVHIQHNDIQQNTDYCNIHVHCLLGDGANI